MSSNKNTVELKIQATDSSKAAFQSAQKSLRDTKQQLQSTNKEFSLFGKTIDLTPVNVALGALTVGIGLATKGFLEFQKSVEQIQIIENQLVFAGIAAQVTMTDIDRLGKSIGNIDDGRRLSKLFLNGRRAMKPFADDMLRLVSLSDNIAKTTGFSSDLVVQRFARIAQGSLSALSRINSRLDLFSKSEMNSLKRMNQFGENAEVARRVADRLEERFGEIDVNDIGVPWRQLGASMTLLWESLGRMTTTVLNPLIGVLTTMVDGISTLSNKLTTIYSTLTDGSFRDSANEFTDELTNGFDSSASAWIRKQTSEMTESIKGWFGDNDVRKETALTPIDNQTLTLTPIVEVDNQTLSKITTSMDKIIEDRAKKISGLLTGKEKIELISDQEIQKLLEAEQSLSRLATNKKINEKKLVSRGAIGDSQQIVDFSDQEKAVLVEKRKAHQALLSDLSKQSVSYLTDWLTRNDNANSEFINLLIDRKKRTQTQIDDFDAKEYQKAVTVGDAMVELYRSRETARLDLEKTAMQKSLDLFEFELDEKDRIQKRKASLTTELKSSKKAFLNSGTKTPKQQLNIDSTALVDSRLNISRVAQSLEIEGAITDSQRDAINDRYQLKNDSIGAVMDLERDYLQFQIDNNSSLTDIQRTHYQNQIDLFKEFDESKRDLQQEALVKAAEDGEILASLTLQSTESMKMMWQNFANDGIGAVSKGIANSIFSQDTLTESLDKTIKQVGRTFVQTLIEIGIQKSILFAADLVMSKKTAVAKTVEMGAIATASAPAAVGSSIATGGGSAITGLASLAIATAAGMALMGSLSGKMHGGGLVPGGSNSEGTYLLRGGEYVSSPNETKLFQKYIQSDNRNNSNQTNNKNISINLNASSVDSEGMSKMLSDYQEQIFEMVSSDTEEENSRYSR